MRVNGYSTPHKPRAKTPHPGSRRGPGATHHPPARPRREESGTLADWRSGIAREAQKILGPLGHKLDWLAFADAWRGEYQPAMEEVRAGKLAFCKLDVLHRHNLDRILPRFVIKGLPEDTARDLNLAWHRLDAWPDVAPGLARLKKRIPV